VTGLEVLFIGLLLGMKHATEVDHLAAVATLVTRENSLGRTLRLGATWGLGHTLTLMFFGGMVLVLGKAISPNLDRSLEFGVGCMLVLLGLDVWRRVISQRIHFHAHRHDGGAPHIHAHSHAGEGAHRLSAHQHKHAAVAMSHWRRVEGAARKDSVGVTGKPASVAGASGFSLRALFVGMMHGLAGSAAMILLSLETVQSWRMGLVYIAVFGIGSMVGMALLSAVISIPLRLSANYLTSLHKTMTVLFGGVSCALGCYMIYNIGFVGGLLVG
jgi:hypothetical protein